MKFSHRTASSLHTRCVINSSSTLFAPFHQASFHLSSFSCFLARSIQPHISQGLPFYRRFASLNDMPGSPAAFSVTKDSTSYLPFFVKATVVRGFGRGNKELGVPTANFADSVVSSLPENVEPGVHFGWASVDGGPVYKMVLTVGWNLHFGNTNKTMETHILHAFDNDFYGSELRVVVAGFIRSMKKFNSLDELIASIHHDIQFARGRLDSPEFQVLSRHPFFNS